MLDKEYTNDELEIIHLAISKFMSIKLLIDGHYLKTIIEQLIEDDCNPKNLTGMQQFVLSDLIDIFSTSILTPDNISDYVNLINKLF